MVLFIFFFKQKTAYEISTRDWSSDVCSSDLGEFLLIVPTGRQLADSRGREVHRVKEQDDLFFPGEIGELYRAPFRARELEFRRFLANFHAAGIDRGVDRKEQKKSNKRY